MTPAIRLSSSRREILAALAIAATAACSCDPMWSSPWEFQDRDASEPSVSRLFELVRRPEREAQGFSSLPRSGRVVLATTKPPRSPPPGWEDVVVSAYIQTETLSRAWYFGGSLAAPVFLCETETYHSRNLVSAPSFNAGRAFREYVEIQFVTDASRLWDPGYRVTRYGSAGPTGVTLSEARALAEEWHVRIPDGGAEIEGADLK